MAEVAENNTFDGLIKEATAKNLNSYISLTENHTIEKSFEDGKWATESSESKDVSGNGSIKHIEQLKELSKPFESDFSFTFNLAKGDTLPKFDNVGKVYEEGKVTLQHKAGEVLLIDVWATWCGPCQKPMQHNQDMLVKNAEAWKDKVRIVAVSVDDDLENLKKRI